MYVSVGIHLQIYMSLEDSLHYKKKKSSRQAASCVFYKTELQFLWLMNSRRGQLWRVC